MAGIGFRIQKLLAGGTITDLFRAYLFSSIIVAGPFMIVMITLLALKSYIQQYLNVDGAWLFLAIVVYAYCFSLIGVGPFLHVAMRYLADKHYMHQIHTVTPTYILLLCIVFGLQFFVALPALISLDFTTYQIWIIMSLYLCINGIWIAMVFLSAGRGFLWIAFAFLVGATTGIALGVYWGGQIGLTGFLQGFAVGQASTFCILTIRVFLEFGYQTPYEFGILSYFRRYPYLIFAGLLYNLGIWVDKLLFWFSDSGEQVYRWLYIFTPYDTAMFFSYCTIIPSMAYFLVQMETSFMKKYHAYFQSIQKRYSLFGINKNRDIMLSNLSNHLKKFVVFQGIISGTVFIFSESIAASLGLNFHQLGILRIGIVGAFFQMSYMILLEVFFYFDFQKESFWMILIFALLNLTLTQVSLWIGLPAYGFGYALAGFFSVLIGYFWINYKLSNINYYTFALQPLQLQAYAFEDEK